MKATWYKSFTIPFTNKRHAGVYQVSTSHLKIQSTTFETNPIVSLQQRLDVSNFPSGVYFLKIGDKVEKFVKY